ncbi:MAG: hypothetical protein AAB443_00730 [Patescibacteria group bacterium]
MFSQTVSALPVLLVLLLGGAMGIGLVTVSVRNETLPKGVIALLLAAAVLTLLATPLELVFQLPKMFWMPIKVFVVATSCAAGAMHLKIGSKPFGTLLFLLTGAYIVEMVVLWMLMGDMGVQQAFYALDWGRVEHKLPGLALILFLAFLLGAWGVGVIEGNLVKMEIPRRLRNFVGLSTAILSLVTIAMTGLYPQSGHPMLWLGINIPLFVLACGLTAVFGRERLKWISFISLFLVFVLLYRILWLFWPYL